jgi:uncharacterized membrane protein YozB (DUF420 family)
VTSVSDLPTVNAALNALSAALLVLGFGFIRRRRIAAHRTCMLGAFLVSGLFLASYLTYHWLAGATRFTGTGAVRALYFTILISHTVLAAAVVPLAVTTLLLGLRSRVHRHRTVARWTLPVWLYVSATGVAVYWLLYHF